LDFGPKLITLRGLSLDRSPVIAPRRPSGVKTVFLCRNADQEFLLIAGNVEQE
jgi:hypothetical protein